MLYFEKKHVRGLLFSFWVLFVFRIKTTTFCCLEILSKHLDGPEMFQKHVSQQIAIIDIFDYQIDMQKKLFCIFLPKVQSIIDKTAKLFMTKLWPTFSDVQADIV